YAQPVSLVFAIMMVTVTTSAAAVVSQSGALAAGCVGLALIGLARIVAIMSTARMTDRHSTRTLETLYAIGAFGHAAAFGVFAASTIYLNLDPGVQAIMLASAIGHAIAVGARDAGRPALAFTQPALVAMPIFAALVVSGSTTYLAFAVSMLLAGPAMAAIIHTQFRTLHDSIHSAEISAHLADTMQVLARTDVVTGLSNRAGLNHTLVETVTGLAENEKLALFWLDLDRFKEVNDLLGHTVGDRVLAAVAERLRAVAPEGSAICRFGGDEFILFCPADSRRSVEALAARVLENVTRPLRLDAERLEVPASMGIAILPDDGSDADALMQCADLALYHAKIGGKNRNRFYDPAMSRSLIRRREIEAELRGAIQRDELSIFFQPIVDLDTGRIRTFEALVRWFHPEKGELLPDEFIPVAEETGLIVTLGNWITAQAARAAVHWPDHVSLAVNLSPLQIKAPGAALGILSALREAGLAPSRLELEVTESLFLEDNQSTAHFIQELSAAGAHFALDDFGTGYSSLGYIDRFPFRKIKVDRSFVSGPKVGRKSEAIIRAVAELGSQLGMEIVAEGLETVEQVATVRAAGCTMGQGYYFSRAVPEYIAAMLLAQERQPISASRAVA
ncbi:MAG: putative bifunctional diguanylate cyclase/phosphodiesterase, partial [Tsuneonella sp.]